MAVKKLVLVLALAALLVACAAPEKKVTPAETAKVHTINIGALVDLSGPLTTYGEDIKDTLTIAKDEINSYFESKGKPYRVDLYVEDTRVDPNIALQKTMALHGKGIKLIIGPMGSGEVKNILQYVSSNKIIIASPSSTAPPKFIGATTPGEKKYVFRFVATDAFQTKAIAKLANELGVKAVVIAHLGNAWGKGLDEYGKAELEKYGITVREDVEYPDPPPADYSPYIATLESAVNDLLKQYSPDEIAVLTFSYEEVATMLAQTSDESPLLKVTWIGCDGTAKSDKVLEVCEKAQKVKLYSTLFAESKGEAYQKLNETYYKKYGKSPYSYGLNAYDAAWVLALSYAEVYDKLGKYDADEMAKVIPEVAKKYSDGEYGVMPVSGYIEFDDYNDRATGNYMIYYVTEDCTWKEAGIWKYDTNEIVWSQ